MAKIQLLSPDTVNQIAAGEVVERPSAVVKELVENSLDAGATAVTIEIKEGGLAFIRITDNGAGIGREEIRVAFERHTTSKIRKAEDLLRIASLGFRGEALSSIAAVAQVELVSKTPGELTGCRYLIEGGEETGFEEIGCPDGTTFVVRNLFYNTPARRKFLKSAMTEAGYIHDLAERLAVSHPAVSFKFINNGQLKLSTSGNGNLKDILYHIHGREVAAELLGVEQKEEGMAVTGFIGKPVILRGNRNYMNYFINGRYIRSAVVNRAIEEAYRPYSMQRRYPFTSLHFVMDPALLDVNVHPAKMELRFTEEERVFRFVLGAVAGALKEKELIVAVRPGREEKEESGRPADAAASRRTAPPEPFEVKRRELSRQEKNRNAVNSPVGLPVQGEAEGGAPSSIAVVQEEASYGGPAAGPPASDSRQLTLFEDRLLSREAVPRHRILGQLFETYWIVEFEDKMYMIDQHAAHEKVLYEKLISSLKDREYLSQMLDPPIILTLTMREEAALKQNREVLERIGFELEPFGGNEYAVRGVPADLLGLAEQELLMELIDAMTESSAGLEAEMVLEKAASLSCKAAVKANHALSFEEARALIDSLLELSNPYHCPHGRPVIISMSKYEIEKKFKRIV